MKRTVTQHLVATVLCCLLGAFLSMPSGARAAAESAPAPVAENRISPKERVARHLEERNAFIRQTDNDLRAAGLVLETGAERGDRRRATAVFTVWQLRVWPEEQQRLRSLLLNAATPAAERQAALIPPADLFLQWENALALVDPALNTRIQEAARAGLPDGDEKFTVYEAKERNSAELFSLLVWVNKNWKLVPCPESFLPHLWKIWPRKDVLQTLESQNAAEAVRDNKTLLFARYLRQIAEGLQ